MKEIKNAVLSADSYYRNKLADGAADPFVLEYKGIYYLYATGGSRFIVRKSKDLITWETVSEPILSLSETTWANINGWAPEVYEYGGKFYFIYSAKSKDNIYCIDIAVCDTPDGHFKPLSDTPFFAPGYSVIDASLLFDDDGRIYMYYSKDCSTNIIDGIRFSQSYGVEVEKDFSGIIGEPVLISTPTYEWEKKSKNPLWNEGPVVFKENGVYYQLYSANFYRSEHYSVGYATSDSPLRLFDKIEDSRILTGNGKTVTGPGHCNIFRSPENREIYIAYHVHTVPPDTAHGRSLAIDRLVVNEDGTLRIDGPTETPRPLPSGINGYVRLEGGYSIAREKDTICVKFDEPASLYSVWVIPPLEENGFGVASLEINGEYTIKDVEFASLGSAVFTLDNIPSGIFIKDLKIILHTSSGENADVVFIAKR